MEYRLGALPLTPLVKNQQIKYVTKQLIYRRSAVKQWVVQMNFHSDTLAVLREPLASAQSNPEALLKAAETLLPNLLREPDKWSSLYIDYEKPHLMRLYRQLGDVRINLHYFLPAQANEIEPSKDVAGTLYHPHPWFSVMRILEGRYTQWFGVANEVLKPEHAPVDAARIAPEQAMVISLGPGDYYSMTRARAWHQVIPFPNQAVSTIMVTAIPKDWDQPPIPAPIHQRQLTGDERTFMFAHFERFFPAPGLAASMPAPNLQQARQNADDYGKPKATGNTLSRT